MAYTFSWVPSKSFSKTIRPRVITAQFGDGYSQRVVNGINSITREWSVNFNSKSINEINEIETFLSNRKGAEGFLWTPPGESTAYAVICPDWSRTYDTHISASLQVKFVQIFDVLT